jgi:16S rRNA C967 or C1407 C5-methylase (RsmB/RsmF family)
MEIVDITSNEIFKNLETKVWIKQFEKSIYKNADKSIRVLPTAQTEGFFVAKFIKK